MNTINIIICSKYCSIYNMINQTVDPLEFENRCFRHNNYIALKNNQIKMKEKLMHIYHCKCKVL